MNPAKFSTSTVLASQERVQREKTLRHLRKNANKIIAQVRAQGCDLPFFDFLQPYMAEFNKIVGWAKTEFPSIHSIMELNHEGMASHDWGRFGIPEDWEYMTFEDENVMADEYPQANQIATASDRHQFGFCSAFRTPAGELRTIVRVFIDPECAVDITDMKYCSKLAVLLHELGHVRDHEQGRFFDHSSKKMDLLGAEISANIYCLEQCYARGYLMAADHIMDQCREWRDNGNSFTTAVGTGVLNSFQPPPVKPWADYQVDV